MMGCLALEVTYEVNADPHFSNKIYSTGRGEGG